MSTVSSPRRRRRVGREKHSPIRSDAYQVDFGVSRDGSGIAYSSVGTGAPLVHLPLGPFFTREMSIELLSQDACAALPALRHVFYDHRAVGLSGGTDRDFSLDAQIDDLDAVVEALDERRVHIFAGLNAAPAAVAYAARNPECVSSLILWLPYLRGRDFHAMHSMDARLTLADADWPMFLQTITVQLFGLDGGARAERYAELVDRVMSRDVLTRSLQEQAKTDVTPMLSLLRTPTLVVHPHGVRRPPASASARLVESIGDARLLLPRGDALVPFHSDHETVRRAITTLMSRVADQPAKGPPTELSHGSLGPPPSPLPAGLSARESQVLCLVADGMTNKQIANDLVVAVGTVKRHTHNIYTKLNVGRRIEAVAKAQSLGLLDPARRKPINGDVRPPRAV